MGGGGVGVGVTGTAVVVGAAVVGSEPMVISFVS